MNKANEIKDGTKSDTPNSKICLECRQPIDAQALKCKECNAYQNWRQHLPLLAVLLTILLGGLSVFSTSYPVAQDILSKDFDMSVKRVGVNSDYYTVMVQNTGRQPAAIKYINIFYGENVDFLHIDGGDTIIPENKSRILRLRLPEGFVRPSDNIDFSRREVGKNNVIQRCEILISVIGSNREEWFEIKEESCWDMHDFLTGIQSVG